MNTVLSEGGALYLSQPPRRIDTGTAQIATRQFGSGPPILFVHGWPFSGFIWRKLLPELSRSYTCITVDLPGAGESQWEDGNDFSFHGHADHLAHVTAALGLSDYRLIAHDTGATVARRLAILDGARVRQMVLIDTEIPHDRPPLVPLALKLLALPGAEATFRRLLRSRRYLRSSLGLGSGFHDPELVEGEFLDHFVQPLLTSPQRLRGQLLYAAGIDWDQLDALAEGHGEIQAEVLLVWGAQDPYFPIDKARAMIPQFRSCAGLIEIPNARLLPFEEYPQIVLEHVQAFFRRRSAETDDARVDTDGPG